MYCQHCGAEIPDGNYCKNCGARIGKGEEEYNDEYEEEYYEKKPVERRDSVLSIVSFVLTLVSIFVFNWLALGGIVCGLIDLLMSDKKKVHLGSWFGVIIGAIVLIYYVINLKRLF